ncbi:MFS transporter [Metapseudomonas boanensis]|uniref:MFS transporter n=1 Tax=Metapseudomonas boanensis TaxID=2822138 RepID=A0ABS5XH60_9GAMM|nr:MFS transporter [Pseudomonas boanensis]
MSPRLAKTMELRLPAEPIRPGEKCESISPVRRPSGHAADALSGLPEPRHAIAIGSVLAAMVLVVLNTAVANVALPTIAESLQVTPAMSIWIVTAYQAALLMALLPCAALGESLGYRRVFRWGVALFTGATLFCALAPSLSWLIAARFLQGLGGAAVMALGIALLRLEVPHRQLGAAIGWNALAVGLSSAAGPAIGAAILSMTSWPWLFAAHLPLGVLVLLSTSALADVEGTARRTDLLSVVLNAGAFASLVIAAGLLADRPLLAGALLAISAIQLMLLVRREMPKEAPLIPLDLLRSNSFCVSVIASTCCFAGQTAGMVALPFYLQNGLGQEPLMAGLYMIPWPLTVAIVAPLAGRLADRWSTAWLCSAGGLCLAVGLGAASLWPLKGIPFLLVPFTMLCGLGFGLFNIANNRKMFLSAPIKRSGAAGGMQGTARLLGQTAGAIIMTLLFNLFPTDSAPQIGLGVGAVLTLLAALTSTLQGRRTESTHSEVS